MTCDRLGLATVTPQAAPGWSIEELVGPAALTGANGMRWGPDGLLYVAQAFGSQVSAVDTADGSARIISAADGQIIAPDDLAFDSRGNLFVTEVMSARVSAIRPNGAVEVIAADVPVANGVTVHGDRIFMSEFRPGGCIWELFADGGAPRLIADGLMMPNALCLGPDDNLYFPLVPLGEVWRVGLTGGVPERVAGGFDIPTAVKFDSGGRLYVVESGNGAVTLVDVVAGSTQAFARVAFGTDNLAFAPDGRLFVSNFTDGKVTEIAPDGTQRVAVAGGMTGPFGLVAGSDGGIVAADGMSLASINSGGTITRPAMLLQHGFPGYVRGVTMTSDHAVIVTNSAGQCARYCPGAAPDVLLDGLDRAMGVVASPCGEIVVCEAGGGRLIAIAADGTARILASGLDRPTGVAEAPRGGYFVSEAGAGRVVHVGDDGVRPVMTGLADPHGVAVSRDRLFVLDRADGSLHEKAERGGASEIVATGLPCGANGAMVPNTLPGIEDIMPGPLLPFADIAAMPNGDIAVGGDRHGSIVLLRGG